MMKKTFKRIMTQILCVLMLLQMLPVNMPAEEGGWQTLASDPIKGETSYLVRFIHGEDVLSQIIVEGGTLETLPEDPFQEGSYFVGWNTEPDGTGTSVVQGMAVTSNMDAYAIFEQLTVYTVTVSYWYHNPTTHEDVVFSEPIYEIEAQDVPYTIIPPSSTEVTELVDPNYPIYYPVVSSLQITSADLAAAQDYTIEKSVQYVPFTATYDYVYYLKDLQGALYGVPPSAGRAWRHEHHRDADILTFAQADFEYLTPTLIDQSTGKEVPAYYTRKEFTLTLESLGGSFIAPLTALYGDTVSVAGLSPTRTGYNFMGWFDAVDENGHAAGNQVTGDVVLAGDQTVYAKWEGQQVGYTILYMREMYDAAGNTYVFDRSATATAQVGTTVVATSAPPLTPGINGYEFDNALNAASSVVIAADGSSVLKVYYSLIRYTIVFNINRSTGRITIGGQTYTGSNYKIHNVVLGENVSARWPAG